MSDPAIRSRYRRFGWSDGIEWMLGALIIGSILTTIGFFRQNGYLPQPFFFNHYDSLMDGYNTAAWAFRKGAYDVWRSIYPPVSLAWFKIFSPGECYIGTEVYARDCDWVLRALLLFFFGLNVVLVFAMYWRHDRITAVPRTIAVAMGMPMLYAMERANLIIQAFTFFILGYGPLLRSSRLRWLGAAMAANFKPYLIAPIFAALLRRKWRWAEGALFACILVWIVAYLIVGDGTPMQVLANTITFADPQRSSDWAVSYYASSYIALDAFMQHGHAPLTLLIGSGPLDFAAWFLPAFMRASQGLTILAAAFAWARPQVIPRYRPAALAVLLALTSQETGGYAVCFALFLVFFERWEGRTRIAVLLLSYLLCFCYDYFLVQLDYQILIESYFAGRKVSASYGLAIGTLVRPGVLLLIMDLLSVATIASVFAALQAEGRITFRGRASDHVKPLKPAAPGF